MNLDMESGAEAPQSPAMRDCRAFLRGLEPREAFGVRRFTAAMGSWPPGQFKMEQVALPEGEG